MWSSREHRVRSGEEATRPGDLPEREWKELAARALHSLGRRKRGRFVARNATTLPDSLLDLELFGTARDHPQAGCRSVRASSGWPTRARCLVLLTRLAAGTRYTILVEARDEAGNWSPTGLYVRDLDLLAPGSPLRVANPIYQEVIVRVLSSMAEDAIVLDGRSFVSLDGTLDLGRILEQFAGFWREHGEVLSSRAAYHEVAPQLVLMAYLQRVVNGGGTIDREYGIGRGRIDLLVRWPWRDASGGRQVQREALELKVWRDGRPDPLTRGLEQLDSYLEGLSLDHGVLVIFDRRTGAPRISERTTFCQATSPGGRAIIVLRA